MSYVKLIAVIKFICYGISVLVSCISFFSVPLFSCDYQYYGGCYFYLVFTS